MLVIVSGPSGVGKSRLIDVACASFGFRYAVPVTTRPIRRGEREGVDYEYVSVAQFQSLIRRGAMLDWDFALRHYYGYRIDLARRVASGENVVIHALARMALRIAARTPNVFLVFLDSPNDTLLEQRLARRNYDELEITLRKLHWWEERQHSAMYDVALIDADRAPDEQLTLLLADVLGRFG